MTDGLLRGTVALVGAGPGDPELLTIRAARLLAAADVVVYDALVGDGVMTLISPTAELIDVGKRPGQSIAQELINVLLIRLAGEGRRVVRLKGGDPFVFGRGGEEAMALAAAGVQCEIVPGISSAIAAPAAAGVPVTFRGMAATFTVVTGHRQHGETPVNWAALAQTGGTLVVLMGVAHRGEIADALMAGGMAADTPVAAIHRATTGAETARRCLLSELGTTAVQSPATLVIGAVAALDVTAIAVATTTQHQRPGRLNDYAASTTTQL